MIILTSQKKVGFELPSSSCKKREVLATEMEVQLSMGRTPKVENGAKPIS